MGAVGHKAGHLVVLGLVNRLCEVGQGAMGPSRPFGPIVCQNKWVEV